MPCLRLDAHSEYIIIYIYIYIKAEFSFGEGLNSVHVA
jgi:hypothetical protein